MSYRDELQQAHERAARLEEELREERAKNAAPKGPPPRPVGVAGKALFLFLVGLILAGTVTVVVVVTQRRASQPLLVKSADELVADARRFEGMQLRVQGELVPNTTVQRGDPRHSCEMMLVIQRRGVRLPVHKRDCVLPETYRDATGILVLATGALGSDGVFEANDIAMKWETMFPGMRDE